MNTYMPETDEGFQRILTIVARGYLWKGIAVVLNHARRVFCAWCSIPDMEKASPKTDWETATGWCFPSQVLQYISASSPSAANSSPVRGFTESDCVAALMRMYQELVKKAK